MVGYQNPFNQGYTNTAPPPPFFLQTCSKVGEERDEFSPIRKTKPPKRSMSQFFGLFYLYLCTSIYIMYICTHLLITGLVGGSAEQPLLAPNGTALNQPKPDPSNRIV